MDNAYRGIMAGVANYKNDTDFYATALRLGRCAGGHVATGDQRGPSCEWLQDWHQGVLPRTPLRPSLWLLMDRARFASRRLKETIRRFGAWATGDLLDLVLMEGSPSTFRAINIRDAASSATTTTEGVVELATVAEAEARSASDKVVTPAGLATFARIATGSYTGDGTTSQGITGLGFQPKVLWITIRETTPGNTVAYFWTSTAIVDDDASGGNLQKFGSQANVTFQDDGIISLDSDGFTVDDDGDNSHPNASGVAYNYWAIG